MKVTFNSLEEKIKRAAKSHLDFIFHSVLEDGSRYPSYENGCAEYSIQHIKEAADEAREKIEVEEFGLFMSDFLHQELDDGEKVDVEKIKFILPKILKTTFVEGE